MDGVGPLATSPPRLSTPSSFDSDGTSESEKAFESEKASESNITPVSLSEVYFSTVRSWRHLVDFWTQLAATEQNSRDRKHEQNLHYVEGCLSILIGWGCDLRVDNGLLDHIKPSTITSAIEVDLLDLRAIATQCAMSPDESSTSLQDPIPYNEISRVLCNLRDNARSTRMSQRADGVGALAPLALSIRSTDDQASADHVVEENYATADSHRSHTL